MKLRYVEDNDDSIYMLQRRLARAAPPEKEGPP